ncbi:MAG: RHS repeat protein, partial [Planctomycetes bacterium]|nr:RHS repeat protein [Planctomycetota bacterium]
LGRQIGEVDGVGNVRARVYDAGGLLVQESVTEVNPLGASETKTYYRSYDGLGRLIRTVDNAGHAVYYANDSRDNHTAETDGRGPLVVDPLGQFADRVNAPGNLKRYVYDGLDRPVLSALDSAPGGEANGATDPWSASFDPSQQSAGATGAAVSSYGYDDNNNLESVVTGSGKVLGFDYDAQNRMVAKTFPDGSQLVFGYKKTGATASASLFDTSGNLFRRVDYAYDAAGRRIAENVTFTAGTPVGTLAREFEYNGLDRPTRMFDDNGAGADATVLAVYDSLRRLLQENQDGHLVSTQLDDTDMLSHLWFPSGRRVDYAYDQNGRLATIDESSGADIATFQYFGRGRLARIDLGNGVRHDLSTPSPNSMLPTGYDAAGRPKRAIHELIGGATLGELRFTYDRNHGRTKTESIITGSPTLADLFVYDSQGRLTDAGIDLFGGVAIDLLQRYDYQGDSNLDHRLVQAAGSPGSNYDHVDNADFGYQSIATLAIGHDVAGNRTSDVWMNYHFDGFDRLARINIRNLDGSDGPLVIEYTYDARGRRASKTDPTSGTTWYYHHGQRVIEERNSSNQLVAQYVHGYGLDDVLQMRRNLDGLPGYEPYYFLSDTRSSIVALTDDSGAVVERYAYDPSGFVRFLEADGSPATTGGMPRLRSAFANPRLYQAREYDHEIAVAKLGAALQGYVTEWTEPTGLYYYRARYHDPAEHRFVSRDPLAPASNNETDPSTLVMRMYTDGFIESPYVRGNNDPFVLDPSGLAAVDTYWVTGCIDNLKGAGRWVGKQGKRAGRGIKKGATWVSKRLPIAALAVSGVAGTAYGLINDSVAGYGECISAYIQDNLTLFSPGVNKALPKWLYANNFPKKCRKGILEVVFPPPAAPAPSQPAGPGGKGPGGPTTPGDNPGAPGGANPKKPFTPGGAPGAPGGNPGGPVTGPTTPGGTPGAPPECGGDGEGEGEDEGGEEEEPEGPTTGPRSAEDGFYLGHGQTCNKDLKGEKEEGNNGPNQSSSERKYGYLPGPASRHLVAFHAEAGRGAVTVAFAVREPADYVIVRGDREVGRGAAVPGRIIEVVDADGNATSSYSLQLATSSGAQVEVGAVRAATARSSAAERALAELAAGGDTGAVATESEVAAVAPATEEPETPGTRPAGWFQLLFLLVAALRLPSPLRR